MASSSRMSRAVSGVQGSVPQPGWGSSAGHCSALLSQHSTSPWAVTV